MDGRVPRRRSLPCRARRRPRCIRGARFTGSGHDGDDLRRRRGASRLVPGRLGLALPAWGRHGRYLAGVLALAGAYYARGQARLRAGVLRSRRRHRLASGRGGDRVSVPSVGCASGPGVLIGDLLANDYSRAPAGLRARPDGREHGRSARGGPADPPSRSRAAHRWTASAASRACSPRSPPRRRSARRSVRCRCWAGDVISGSELPEVARTWWLGDAAGALIVIPLALAWYQPPPRGWARGRAVEAVLMLAAVAGMSQIAFRSREPAGLSRLPGAGLGRAALRPPRRHAGDRRRGRLRGLEHHALPRAVRLRLDHAQRPHDPALHRRGGTVDAVPRRAGLRAQAVRRGARRLARPARQGVGHRAPTTRTQPARRRPTAPHRARRAARARRRSRARGARAGRGGPRASRGRRWSW